MTVMLREHPVEPEGWTLTRRGNPEHWSLSHDEALALIAVADERGVRVGQIGRLAVRVSDEDPRVFQKDGYSPNRWAWGFAIRVPGTRDMWLRWPIHTAFDLFAQLHRIGGLRPHEADRAARDDARAWHRQPATPIGRNA